MNSWKMKAFLKKVGHYGLIAFISITLYQLNQAGAFKRNFRYFKPAVAKVFGTYPIIGKPIRRWAYSGKRYRGSRKAVSRKGKKRRRRSRRRRRR